MASLIDRWFEQVRLRENQLALVMALVIGALVGLVVVGFIVVTGRLAAHLYPANGEAWRRVVLPVAGALVSGWMLARWFPFARGSGIPQTRAAMVIHDGVISARAVVGKFLCCSTALASGIALGREGPSVQMGAGIASILARRLRLSPAQVKALVPVGAAAALAAAFNTPIAAVLFSLEEIVGDLHAPVLGSVVLSSATAWMVLHLFLGDEPLFHVAPYHLVSAAEFPFYALLGVVGGFGSAAFTKLLLWLRERFKRMTRVPTWVQPAAGGLTVGVMGYFLPDVMGVGYPTIEHTLAGGMLIRTAIILAVCKLVATAVCYASGNAGGIFGPSLFIGAMLGAAVGGFAHTIAPMHTATMGAYALVGMGTAFAGIVRTPMTSVIMIFELTRDYSIIVPLMLSNMIAFFISYRLQREPIYEALAHQDGIHLPKLIARVRAHLQVGRAMRRIPLQQGQPVTPAPSDTPHLHLDQDLGTALERMGASKIETLPVVSRDDVTHVLGMISLEDVLQAYGLPSHPAQPPEE